MPVFEINSGAVQKFIESIGSINQKYDISKLSQLQMEASNNELKTTGE